MNCTDDIFKYFFHFMTRGGYRGFSVFLAGLFCRDNQRQREFDLELCPHFHPWLLLL